MNCLLHLLLIESACAGKSPLRIVGGRFTYPGEFPFIVRLEYNNLESFCTGSALTPTWTLSAAHCATGHVFDGNILVRYNNHFPSTMEETSEVLSVALHPGFEEVDDKLRYDICLFKTKAIRVAKFAKLSALDYWTLEGREAFAVGYGVTNTTLDPEPLQVLKGMLSRCDPKDSDDLYAAICLKAPCGSKSIITPGDSGGPVIHSSGIVGVNSLAYGNYDSANERIVLTLSEPAVILAATSTSLDWIAGTIKGNINT